MSLGSKYLARKSKSTKTEISLGNVGDALMPLLYTLNVIKPKDEVTSIDFDWHNIVGDMCPITIYYRKEASRTRND
jgi:hypothetical protein